MDLSCWAPFTSLPIGFALLNGSPRFIQRLARSSSGRSSSSMQIFSKCFQVRALVLIKNNWNGNLETPCPKWCLSEEHGGLQRSSQTRPNSLISNYRWSIGHQHHTWRTTGWTHSRLRFKTAIGRDRQVATTMEPYLHNLQGIAANCMNIGFRPLFVRHGALLRLWPRRGAEKWKSGYISFIWSIQCLDLSS